MDRNQYLKIAHWYYTLGLTQEEIGRRLSITRQRVNRIIGDLTKLGIVTIKVNGINQGSVHKEHLIEKYFGIDRVVIAERFAAGDPYFPVLAHTAAYYIEECIQPGMIIGTAW
ncbi:MAG: helix-turn-helix domain-containing protein, partial [Spirochaetes bacterium]|nr:helix-turn-helix domain-containing protein [Spirochaetota bacterium]